MAADLTTPIVFDLDLTWKPADSAALDLQRTAWRELREQLEKRIAELPGVDGSKRQNAKSQERAPVHQTILINGSRGSGKSTFVHALRQTIMNAAKSGSIADDKRVGDLSEAIQVLRPLDPTLVEKAEHPVVTLVQVINEQVEAHKGDEKLKGREDYDKALKNLEQGLSVLEGVGKDRIYEGWEDASVVAESALARAKSGAKLATALEVYAKEALAIFGKKAFLLTIDDIDTQFERGWPMIEALRKYFNIPQFIAIVAGDLTLYTLLVRRAQFENLGDGLLRHGRAHRDHHRDDDRIAWHADPLRTVVDDLEQQYMLKVMKPENRLNLMTLSQIAEGPQGDKVLVKLGDAGNIRLVEGVDRLLRLVLHIHKDDDILVHRQAILRQPLRSVAQFLAIGRELLTSNPADPTYASLVLRFRQRFSDLAGISLLHQGIRLADFDGAGPARASAMLVEWIESNGIWDVGHHLRPCYASDDMNMVAMVFGMKFAGFFESNSGEAFAFFIRVCMTRSLVLQASSPNQRRRILAFLDIGTERPLVESGRRWTVAQRALVRPGTSAVLGTIPVITGKARTAAGALEALYGKGVRGKILRPFPNVIQPADPRVPVLKSWFDSIEMTLYRREGFSGPTMAPWLGFAYNTTDSLAGRITNGNLVYASTAVSTRLGARSTTISSLVLLGSVADVLLNRVRGDSYTGLMVPSPISEPDFDAIDKPVLSDQVTYKAGVDEDADDGTDIEQGDVAGKRSGLEEIAELYEVQPIVGLFTAPDRKAPVHPSVLSRAADRFCGALASMDDTFPVRAEYTGWLIGRHLVALKNALLVEELTEQTTRRKLKLANPIWTDGEYRDNLDALASRRQAHLHSSVEECTFLNFFLCETAEDPHPPKAGKGIRRPVWFMAEGAGEVDTREITSFWDALNTLPVANKRKTKGPWKFEVLQDPDESPKTSAKRNG